MKPGIIHWVFKGKSMSAEKALVKDQKAKNKMIVETKHNKHPYEFLLIENQWLLSGNVSTNSLLCGTHFVEGK